MLYKCTVHRRKFFTTLQDDKISPITYSSKPLNSIAIDLFPLLEARQISTRQAQFFHVSTKDEQRPWV